MSRPRPLPQPEQPHLSPLGVVEENEDGTAVRCHLCGHWYAHLPPHLTGRHGMSALAYKERFSLSQAIPLSSRHWRSLQRANALERDQAAQVASYRDRLTGPRDRHRSPTLSARLALQATHDALVRADPSVRARLQAAGTIGGQRRRRLSDEQEAAVRALAGQQSVAATARQFGVSDGVVRRLWAPSKRYE